MTQITTEEYVYPVTWEKYSATSLINDLSTFLMTTIFCRNAKLVFYQIAAQRTIYLHSRLYLIKN